MAGSDDTRRHAAEWQDNPRHVQLDEKLSVDLETATAAHQRSVETIPRNCAARKNTRYGTPPDGMFITEPYTKLPTRSGTSVRRNIHHTPRWVFEYSVFSALKERTRGSDGTATPQPHGHRRGLARRPRYSIRPLYQTTALRFFSSWR